MIKIENNEVIRLTRGDACNINLTIQDSEGVEYTPLPGDKFIFTIKPDINNDYYVFRKEFTNLSLTLRKEDTIDLNFGEYFFDIRLENVQNYDTILNQGTFILEGGTANARS